MGAFDNPSADKFVPPPGSADPQPIPTGPSAGRRIVSFVVLLPLLRIAVQHYGGHALWAGAALFALMIAEYGVALKRHADRGPYSSNSHVTR